MPNYPRRCQHIKVDGIQCGSPSLRRSRFCFFHKRYHEQRINLSAKQARRNRSFDLPVLEDANSVQVALMQVLRMVANGSLDQRSASLMLYGLQTASNNLRNVRFEPIDGHDVVLDPREARDTPLFASEQWSDEDYEQESEEDQTDAYLLDCAKALNPAEKKRQANADYFALMRECVRKPMGMAETLLLQLGPPFPTEKSS